MTEPTTSTAAESPQDRRRRLEALLRKKAANSRSFPLSFAQERLWILDRLDPENPVYNVPLAIRLSGPMDLDVLQRTFNEIVARHEVLRTKIASADDQPLQVVEPLKPQKLWTIDLEHVEQSEREAEALARAEAAARQPFRLDESPLFRASLLRFSSTEHVLLVVMHHIISDEWSMAVLFREMALLYAAFRDGRPSPLGPLSVQYADYAVWQRERLQGPHLEQLLEYWSEQLRDVPALELPTDPARAVENEQQGGGEELLLPTALLDRLREVGRRESATLYMTLLAAVQVLLYRHTGQEDFAVGSPIAGRLGKDTEGLVGFFVNTLVMRGKPTAETTFRNLLREARQTALGAFEHQELPFERLVNALNPDRAANRNPLFQVMYTLQNVNVPEVKLAGISLSPIPLDTGMSKFDLSFTMNEQPDGLLVSAEFRLELFRPGTIQRMLKHFRTLVEGIVLDPERPIGELPMLSEAERHQLLVEWNATDRDYLSDVCVQELFELQAEQSPLAVAVVDGARSWTYAELDERSNRLAHYLQQKGVGPDQIVGIRLSRSFNWVVGLLGILKAGGAYLPLDPDAPAERLRFMLEDAQVKVIVTEQRLGGELPPGPRQIVCLDGEWEQIEKLPADAPAARSASRSLAYVIYTSGSTGRPKGVMIEHRALANYTQAAVEQYAITAADRVLQFAAPTFDAHVEEVFPTLTSGAALVLRNDELLDARTFLQTCGAWRLTFVTLPTGFWHELILAIAAERLAVPASLRLLVIGGEQALAERVAAWFQHVGTRVRLLNTYGPTETTVVATAAELGRNDGREQSVPIGRPLGNTQVYVLDRSRNPVAVGVPGELYIGGASLARGYLNRPDLTHERFVDDPFGPTAGGKLYKTGDMVRWRGDHRLEFLGRIDDQVKIRGFRIELGEVEQVLREHPLVTAAAVLAQARAADDLQLVAYVTGPPDEPNVGSALRQFLRQRLPEFMVPAAFVILQSFPLTSSGKLDRKALPGPSWGSGTSERGQDFIPPRSAAEEQLAAIWSEVLNVEPVGAHDNFFDLGGNSLLAVRLIGRVRKSLAADLPLLALFTAPTVAELSAEIAKLRPPQADDGLPEIRRRDGNVAPPMSYNQEPFWIVSNLEQGPAPYAFHPALRINGALNVYALEQSLAAIVQRHESLRTTFAEAGNQIVQVVAPYRAERLKIVDLTGLPAELREVEVRRYAKEESARRIDLVTGPLLRLELLKLSEDEHVVLVGMHHIIYDGWSLDIFGRELLTAYLAFAAGQKPALPELPIQYGDFAVWQRGRLGGEVLERLRDYWLPQLQGLPSLDLPTDRKRPAVRTTNSAVCERRLPSELNRAIGQLAANQQATKFMALLAAFQTLLHRYSGQDDFAVGTPAAGRLRPETENLIGCFINDLVLRADLAGDPSFGALLTRVRKTVLEAFDHQEMPFMRLVRELKTPRDPSRRTLVQTELIFHEEAPEQNLPGLELSELRKLNEAEGADFDLCLEAFEGPDGLDLRLCYQADLFEPATVERMLEHFQMILEGVTANPDQSVSRVSLLSDRERQTVLVDWNETQVAFAEQGGVHELFEQHAQRAADAPALVFEGETVTYAELNRRANQLAHYLRRLQVGPGVRVGIFLNPSADAIVAILAVLKAGGAYVPLNPEDPAARVEFFATDSQVKVVVTQAGTFEGRVELSARVLRLDEESAAIAQESEKNPAPQAGPDDAIFVLYTSGSTGAPKGVENLHRGISNYILAKRQLAGIGPSDRVLLGTPMSFDTSVEEIFFALACGGCLVVERVGGQNREMASLVQLIVQEKVTTACFVPSTLRLLLEEETLDQCTSLKRVFVGGEVLTPELVERFFDRLDAELYNEYGPTEAAIDVAVWKCRRDYGPGLIPIGRPIANVRLYVLDAAGNPVPVGVPGELYIGGVAVARGYVDRPQLNAEVFLPDRFVNGGRMYRTGDRCRWLPDGNIEFFGRRDGQVKIHGGRLELGDVEAAIARHADVAQVAVIARQSSADYKYLAAYIAPRGRGVGSTQEQMDFANDLRQFLKALLPDYMLPQSFEFVDALPRLSSGKIDRGSLQSLAGSAKQARRYAAPRNPLERQLAAIWGELLGAERVGIHDNFFDVGGDSLAAVRFVLRLRGERAIDLPAAEFFASPTIAALAKRIEAAVANKPGDPPAVTPTSAAIAKPPASPQPAVATLSNSGDKSLVRLRGGGPGVPLFCMHGLGGHVAGFFPLAVLLAEGRPVYGLQAQGLSPGETPHDHVEDMAAFYIHQMRKVQPAGPYLLSGWSLGGSIALEAARQLVAAGQQVSLVAMFDTCLSDSDYEDLDPGDHSAIGWIAPRIQLTLEDLKPLPLAVQWQRIAEQAKLVEGPGVADIRLLAAVCNAHLKAAKLYRPGPYEGPVVLFQAEEGRMRFDEHWKSVLPRLAVRPCPGDHYTLLRKPHVDSLAERLLHELQAVSIGEMAAQP